MPLHEWTLDQLRRNVASLKCLTLESRHINDEDCKLLALALEENTSLTTLRLANNHIGPKGAKCLAQLLARSNSITELCLNHNHIRVLGCVALAHALTSNKSLLILRLRNNEIGDEGAAALLFAVGKNCSIEEIQLDDAISSDSAVHNQVQAFLDANKFHKKSRLRLHYPMEESDLESVFLTDDELQNFWT